MCHTTCEVSAGARIGYYKLLASLAMQLNYSIEKLTQSRAGRARVGVHLSTII